MAASGTVWDLRSEGPSPLAGGGRGGWDPAGCLRHRPVPLQPSARVSRTNLEHQRCMSITSLIPAEPGLRGGRGLTPEFSPDAGSGRFPGRGTARSGTGSTGLPDGGNRVRGDGPRRLAVRCGEVSLCGVERANNGTVMARDLRGCAYEGSRAWRGLSLERWGSGSGWWRWAVSPCRGWRRVERGSGSEPKGVAKRYCAAVRTCYIARPLLNGAGNTWANLQHTVLYASTTDSDSIEGL